MSATDADTAGATGTEQPAHWNMMKKVLVATDGSLSAADAISFAVEFASHHQAELVFVHVVPTIDFVRPVELDETGVAFPHEPTEHDHALLHQASAVVAEHGVTATTVLLGGSTADEIVAHAESCDIDLIVIGSRWTWRRCQRPPRQRCAGCSPRVEAAGARCPVRAARARARSCSRVMTPSARPRRQLGGAQSMRSDITPGGTFPDYELPDHTETTRKLSELQGADPMILTLARGHYCPKEHQQHLALAACQSKIAVAYTQIVTISTDATTSSRNSARSVGAQWTFLSDPGRTIQQELDIQEYTDPDHNPMIPHTLVLNPGLVVHSIYNGYWFWGRPSVDDLWRDPRAATSQIRPDWDLGTPGLPSPGTRATAPVPRMGHEVG